MSQGTLLLPTTGTLSGLALVGDINTALDALVTNALGSSAPTNAGTGAPEEGQAWINSTSTTRKYQLYDGASWLPLGSYDSTAHVWKPPVGGGSTTLASAATTDLGSIPDSAVSITGTTGITSFGSSAPLGSTKFIAFAGALTLTYNATSMILPSGASITTAAGDTCTATQTSAGNWTVNSYTRATGKALVAPAGLSFPGAITGYLPSSIAGSSSTATMTVAAGFATDSTGAATLNLASPASWAVANGNAANGYQGGATLPNSSTIHMFHCYGGSGNCVFASTSLTPTPPTGYATYYRRIFSFVTGAGGAPLPITAYEVQGGAIQVWLTTPLMDINNGTNATYATARALFTVTAPQGIKVSWNGRWNTDASGYHAIITSPDEPDVAPSTSFSASPLFDSFGTQALGMASIRPIVTNTSGQIGFRADGASPQLYAVTTGWTDFRRS